MKIPQLHIGTAGWSYKDWVPGFYPKNQTKNFDWLQFYMQYFNCVEVNASYYTYLNPRVIESWINKTEGYDDFLFTIKLHQDFTHKRNYNIEKIQSVRFNLDKLATVEKLGGLLIQFPYSFYYSSANAEYVTKLVNEFSEYSLVVEVRHKSWFNNDVYKNFKKLNISWCVVDQPQIGEAVPFKVLATNDSAYIRFHGRNEEAWKNSISNFGKKQTYDEQNARYNYLYSPGELVEIDQQIREIFDKVKKVFVIMNNHPHGDAVANAFELLHLLNDRIKVTMPQTIINAYPRLEELNLN